MRLVLGSRSFDLTSRALIMGTVGGAVSVAGAVGEGADIVELDDGVALARLAGMEPPVCVAVAGDAEVDAALAAGASLLRLGFGASAATYRRCAAAAGVAVVVAPAVVPDVEAAGMPADRIVVDRRHPGGGHPELVDVTDCACPVAATAAAVVRGARIVRTADVRGARRICDVLAAVWEAGG